MRLLRSEIQPKRQPAATQTARVREGTAVPVPLLSASHQTHRQLTGPHETETSIPSDSHHKSSRNCQNCLKCISAITYSTVFFLIVYLNTVYLKIITNSLNTYIFILYFPSLYLNLLPLYLYCQNFVTV